MMSSRTIEHLDLVKLPVNQKETLCKILDLNDSYEELGKLMKFAEFDIAVSNLSCVDEAKFLIKTVLEYKIRRGSSSSVTFRCSHNEMVFKVCSQHHRAV